MMPHADPKARAAYHKAYTRHYLADPAKRAKVNAVANERAKSLRRFLNSVKVTAGCVDCSYDAHAVALDFDHVAGKNITISVKCKSVRAAVAEMALCEVRCANCHRVKTHPCKPGIFEATYEPVDGAP